MNKDYIFCKCFNSRKWQLVVDGFILTGKCVCGENINSTHSAEIKAIRGPYIYSSKFVEETLNQLNKADDKWNNKFENSKEGKIMSLVYDVKLMDVNFQHYSKLTFLASALYISSKGTKHEKDCKNLINEICPEFFTE